MDYKEFCLWLHGFFTMAEDRRVSAEQVAKIKHRLNSVFAMVEAPKLVMAPAFNPGAHEEEE